MVIHDINNTVNIPKQILSRNPSSQPKPTSDAVVAART